MNLEPCVTTINQYLSNRVSGLNRLKEMLPVLFQYHKIYTTDKKRSILLACNLAPTMHQWEVTFDLPLETLKMEGLYKEDSQGPKHLKLKAVLSSPERFSLKLAKTRR